MTAKRINKEEKRNQLHKAYREYHELKQRQLYFSEDIPDAENQEAFQIMVKKLGDIESDIKRLKGQLGL